MKTNAKTNQLNSMQTDSRRAANYVAPASKAVISGDLGDFVARRLFDRLHQERFTGQLLLTHRDKRKKIIFWRGEVIKIHSNLMPELFGNLMVDRGWLNEVDLQKLLGMQKNFGVGSPQSKRLGELVEETHGIEKNEIEELYKVQKIHSLLQAVSWDEGAYEMNALDLQMSEEPVISYSEIAKSIDGLFDVTSNHLGPLFQHIRPWQPKSSGVDLSKTPLWSVLAGCRLAGVNGILSIRKQNKLFEIVIKFGIPLVLYEGTFGQPRQTIVVRQASDEHEKFFLDQIFKLFSFLSGSAHFRILADQSTSEDERDSFLHVREDTHIARSGHAEDIPFDLTSHFLAEKRGFLTRLKDRIIHYIRK